jgi:N-acetylglucosaminyl-diphospho-decaprenol L-rhamnosyltransferase
MKITTLIISYKSLEKLDNCINSIGLNEKIIVIENSNNKQIKEVIEKKYINTKVILNNSNLGYAKASNIGFELINTEYAFLINTDIVITEKQIDQIKESLIELNDDFALATPLSDDLIDFNRNNKIDKYFDKEINIFNIKNKISKIELVKGCSLIVNLKKFTNKKIFDENFFFFFEEIDLCRKIKEKGENIYLLNNIKINHKNAQSVDKNLLLNYDNFRHWNYFWGKFYYFKKHYGYFYAFNKHFGKLIRFAFNALRFYFFSKNQYLSNKYRFLGLFCSIIGKSSKISVKILEG